jgi:hypothetical protein
MYVTSIVSSSPATMKLPMNRAINGIVICGAWVMLASGVVRTRH